MFWPLGVRQDSLCRLVDWAQAQWPGPGDLGDWDARRGKIGC